MIVNLRGNNGSGKTTVIRSFFDQFPQRGLCGLLGPKYPEAYQLTLENKKALYIIGPYHSRTGGIDALSGRGFDGIIGLLDKYSKRGHVLFEGVVISTSFGVVGEWLYTHKKDSIVAFLDTPLDVCFDSIMARTGDGGRSKHVKDKARAIERVKQRMIDRGMRVEVVSRANAFASIKGWLV